MWRYADTPNKMDGLIADLLETIEKSGINGGDVREIPDMLKAALTEQQDSMLYHTPFKIYR